MFHKIFGIDYSNHALWDALDAWDNLPTRSKWQFVLIVFLSPLELLEIEIKKKLRIYPFING